MSASGRRPDLGEKTLHAGSNPRLGEERTGGFHPEDAVQHPQPLLQQVGGVGLQVVLPLARHDLHTTTHHNTADLCRLHVFLRVGAFFSSRHLTRYKTLRADHLEDLLSISTSDAAGGVDLNLTLRFPDHVTLRTHTKPIFSVTILDLF